MFTLTEVKPSPNFLAWEESCQMVVEQGEKGSWGW